VRANASSLASPFKDETIPSGEHVIFFEEVKFLWWAVSPLDRDIKAQAAAGEDQQAALILFHQPTYTALPQLLHCLQDGQTHLALPLSVCFAHYAPVMVIGRSPERGGADELCLALLLACSTATRSLHANQPDGPAFMLHCLRCVATLAVSREQQKSVSGMPGGANVYIEWAITHYK
jgi:hypothetical protein